eukprot:3091596-Pleurochrysis_carterae.AAC.2
MRQTAKVIAGVAYRGERNDFRRSRLIFLHVICCALLSCLRGAKHSIRANMRSTVKQRLFNSEHICSQSGHDCCRGGRF